MHVKFCVHVCVRVCVGVTCVCMCAQKRAAAYQAPSGSMQKEKVAEEFLLIITTHVFNV